MLVYLIDLEQIWLLKPLSYFFFFFKLLQSEINIYCIRNHNVSICLLNLGQMVQ